MNKQYISYSGLRILALMRGKENIDDFGTELQTFTIYDVGRDLIIGCNENNISDWFNNSIEKTEGKL